MSIRKLLVSTVLAAGLVVPGSAIAKDKESKKDKNKAKDAVEWRSRTERERYGYQPDPYAWPRETKGHRPHDNNGDGIVTRNEWPGDANAFRQLDRNGDGVLSEADRKLTGNDKSRVHGSR